MSEKKRRLEAEDLYRFQLVSDPQIAPDGRQVAFCLERVDRKTEKKYTNLWLAPCDGGEPRPLTHGDHRDTHPLWSPDGRHLAFLSDRQDDDQKQIYLLPLYGGEARPLTSMKGEFETFAWSPDGRQLVCQFRQKDPDALEREEDEAKKKLGVVARHFTRVFFKLDGAGYLPQERWHLWTVDVESGQASQLTEGDFFDEGSPCWSPDGREIAFLSNHSPDPDLDPEAVDLFAIPAVGGELRRIETPVGQKALPSYSPDGRWLAYIGREGRGDWWKNDSLWIIAPDGSGPARNLTAEHDIHVGNGTLGDIADRPTVRPNWSADSQSLTFQVTRHGNTTLQAISLDGGELTSVLPGPGVVGTFTSDETRGRIACFLARATDPGQVWLKDLDGGDLRPLTNFNESLFEELELGETEEVWFKGAAGNDLQGWIVKPPNFDPGRKYPAIVEIHGGPFLQYGNLFMYEFHYLAAQDYVVCFSNPRGGQGYGEAHSQAISDNWGTVDYADVMAWADTVEALPYVDPERMGVTGGSYGGFMTGWIIGHTDRFKAAVAQRVVSNLVSMWGSSDFNWLFQYEFGCKPPWENTENFWRQSPIAYIGQARTPTLVIHSEQDMRCDLEQGLQLYVALKWLGVDSELLLFPNESHGLSRGGRTDRRVVRLTHIKRWFDRYLKP